MDNVCTAQVSVNTQEYINLLKHRVEKELNRLKTKYNPEAKPKFSLEMPRVVFDCIFGDVINGDDCIRYQKKRLGLVEDHITVNKEDLVPILGDNWWKVTVYAEKDSNIVSGYFGTSDYITIIFINNPNMVGQVTLTSTGEYRNTYGNLQ